ncbi:MAG: hypothetical protein HY262_06930 [Chloroflexi bacterium]|nr:hypothetical protein [Chloroflexota bacterium]
MTAMSSLEPTKEGTDLDGSRGVPITCPVDTRFVLDQEIRLKLATTTGCEVLVFG